MKPDRLKYCLLLFLCITKTLALLSQSTDCNFKSPVITIDFGDDRKPKNFLLTQLQDHYRGVQGVCPDDGQFTFSSYTKDCFNGNWISFYKDHTAGSVNGRMMIVNAAYTPATFFSITLSALKPNTTYEIATWFVNICPGKQGCEPTPPQIRMSVIADGKLLSSAYTGPIGPTGTDTWRRYTAMFRTPASFSGIVVAMDDLTTGGCGNDFAMDDLEVRECRIIQPVPPPAPKSQPVVKNNPAPQKVISKPVIKPQPKVVEPEPKVKAKEVAAVKKETVVKQTESKPVIKPTMIALPVPAVIKERDNPVIEKIEAWESEITLELYDNGEIDGDTVTIYHNNKKIVSHAGLSTKPVTVKIKVDKDNPHHELVMVADNLGSIPPNTSLMVITTKEKRYEVFISSTEQKNAKLLIDLRKE